MKEKIVKKCCICSYCGEFTRVLTRDYNRKMSREVFEYYICPRCGCMALNNVPSDLSRYYGMGYYSFDMSKTENSVFNPPLKTRKDLYYLSGRGVLGFLYSLYDNSKQAYKTIRMLAEHRRSILDIGCGDGYLLKLLESIGYTDLTGVDLYLPDDKTKMDGNIKLIKGDVFDLRRKYDLIILHHSFEHMSEPQRVLCKLSELLNYNGRIVLSVPVANSRLQKKYGRYWFQLDAPRHLFLHTRKSISIMSKRAKLELDSFKYDSFFGPYVFTVDNYKKRKQEFGLRFWLESVFFGGVSRIDNIMSRSDQATFVLKRQ